jgi:hypothetical protein
MPQIFHRETALHFFVLSRGREKRQQLSARRKESNMKDQNKRIFFSFKTIAKNHFDRTNLSKDLSLYSNSPYLRQEAVQVEGSRPTSASKRTEGRTSVKVSLIVDKERTEVTTK